jgi:hypothetical protein
VLRLAPDALPSKWPQDRGNTPLKASSKVVGPGLCPSSDMLVVISLSHHILLLTCPCSMLVVVGVVVGVVVVGSCSLL